MRLRQALILALLLSAVAAAGSLSLQRLKAARVAEALRVVQTHRFGRSTKSRLGAHLKRHFPDRAQRWSARAQGAFSPVLVELVVDLKGEALIYTFKVGGAFKVEGDEIICADEQTCALIDQIKDADL
ncbi:hypothetical protein KKF91_12960 [Myxococcota bacterium]|nr:hypothetical protein [Myxococcota bacterium]MBU1431445.1 hypothetical protein [Myxococcota bacterium]MBU1896409.1 hypothetical protein [Myxococcota bacterium]